MKMCANGFAALVFLSALVAQAETAPAVPEASDAVVAPRNAAQSKLPRPVKIQSKEEVRKAFSTLFNTTEPLVLDHKFGYFPKKSVDQVVVFDGMAAFKEFVTKEQVTIARIADFSNVVMPEAAVEAKFRNALKEHAAFCGADYVVIITDEQELEQNFVMDKLTPWVYGAVAFRKSQARLGIIPDAKLYREQAKTKIAGFLPGAQAEKAGLKIGDVLLSVNDVAFDNVAFWDTALRWKAGDKVKVEAERNGEKKQFEVELISMQSPGSAAK